MEAPTWLPDWRDEMAYPPNLTQRPCWKWTPTAWAWEYLRRNPDYQQDFENWGESTNIPRELIEKYGLLVTLIDPAKDFILALRQWGSLFRAQDPPRILQGDVLARLSQHSSLYLRTLEVTNPTHVVFQFELDKDIDEQLVECKKILRRAQRRVVHTKQMRKPLRAKRASNTLYLRILDAHAVDADIDDIASVLFPHKSNEHPDFNGKQSVRDSLRAAIRLRDHDYRYLPRPETQHFYPVIDDASMK